MTNGIKNFDTDSLAWLVWEFDRNPAAEADTEASNPGFPGRVRAEFALRLESRGLTELPPRHMREGRFDRIR